MGGVRIAGRAAVAPPVGLPYTVYSLLDYLYLAQGLVEVSDKLTNTFDEANNAVLSPNGQWIALNANFPNGAPNFEGEIFVEASTAVTGTPAPFVVSGPDAAGGWALHPSWHPDSDHLLYVRGRDGFQGDVIEIQRSNPGVETAIYTNPDSSGATGHGVYRPQYNRDGTKVAWIRDKNAAPTDNASGLYVADADGSNLTLIDDSSGTIDGYFYSGDQFSWGPGDVIVYSLPDDVQLYKINADGTGKTLLSSDVDTSAAECQVSARCWPPGDGYVLGVAHTSKNFAGSWDMWRWELDGSGGTWIDLGVDGPDGDQNFRNVYVHVDGRVYMIENNAQGKMISCLPDGTDITLDVDLGVNMDGDSFYIGSGIQWI